MTSCPDNSFEALSAHGLLRCLHASSASIFPAILQLPPRSIPHYLRCSQCLLYVGPICILCGLSEVQSTAPETTNSLKVTHLRSIVIAQLCPKYSASPTEFAQVLEVTNGALSADEMEVISPVVQGTSKDETDHMFFQVLCQHYVPWRCVSFFPTFRSILGTCGHPAERILHGTYVPVQHYYKMNTSSAS